MSGGPLIQPTLCEKGAVVESHGVSSFCVRLFRLENVRVLYRQVGRAAGFRVSV
jgi:hypothetical protein